MAETLVASALPILSIHLLLCELCRRLEETEKRRHERRFSWVRHFLRGVPPL